MEEKPLVSIIIPTYNRATDLARALASVQAQTFSNWEAIVIDNYSSDNTDNVVHRFNDPRIKLFKINNKGVIGVSRNIGIHVASGEFIAFLDSDDWWKPEKLKLSIEALKGGADIVYHDLWRVSKNSQRLFLKKITTSALKNPVFNDLLTRGNCINNSSVVVKKRILNIIGGISEDLDLVAAEDYDCWLRIAKFTDKFTRLPNTLGYYWAGGGNTSNPRRTISILDVIEERYFSNNPKCAINSDVYWINYSRGRSYFLMYDFQSAKKFLNKIRWIDSPLSIYIKSQWMLLLCRFSPLFWLHKNFFDNYNE